MEHLEDLPAEVAQELQRFVAAAQAAFAEDLKAVVLYGSAAEGRLRATSDVNVILVLRRFGRPAADAIREAFRAGHAAVRLGVMFLLESELDAAMTAFAVKFDDILSRRRVLFGEDPFVGREVSSEAARRRLCQLLLNLRLRLRERYALLSLREEQLARLVADFAAPLRSCAATLLKLEGRPADSPKTALQAAVADMGEPRLEAALGLMSEARERRALTPGAAEGLVFDLLEIVDRLQARAERMG
jgi:predicted nucleotidyltransferase